MNATAIGFTLGLGMFAAIAFVPDLPADVFRILRGGIRSADAAHDGRPHGHHDLLGIRITKTGKYKIFPIARGRADHCGNARLTTLWRPLRSG